MASAEKLEEIHLNLKLVLELVLQNIKATTQDENETKRLILNSVEKIFGSPTLPENISKSSSLFSRFDYTKENGTKSKKDAFGRQRPVDDDDDYRLPFLSKKNSLNDAKSVSSTDEDLLPSHNPFVKGFQSGANKTPIQNNNRSGFLRAEEAPKELPFAVSKAPSSYHRENWRDSPNPSRASYQNFTRYRSAPRQRGRSREIDNRTSRGWENRSKFYYRGGSTTTRYDFRSNNRYERTETKYINESPDRRSEKLGAFYLGQKADEATEKANTFWSDEDDIPLPTQKKVDAFGNARAVDDDLDSPLSTQNKVDAFGNARAVDDDLDSPLPIFISKKANSAKTVLSPKIAELLEKFGNKTE